MTSYIKIPVELFQLPNLGGYKLSILSLIVAFGRKSPGMSSGELAKVLK